MKTKTTLFSILFAIGIGIAIVSKANNITIKDQKVNSVVGDISYLEKFAKLPDKITNENLRLTTHLEWVENNLRKKDVSFLSSKLKERRMLMLDLLHAYWTNGVFPKNYDYPGERKSCFIDKDGNICAVGYLVAQTAGIETAQKINLLYKYNKIKDMNMPELNEWIANSGFTKEECGMIQPSYGFPHQTDSVFIIPLNPSAGDMVKIVAKNTRYITYAPITQYTVNGSAIKADLFYVDQLMGQSFFIYDTITLGILPVGNYNLSFRLYTYMEDSMQYNYRIDSTFLNFSVGTTGINDNVNSKLALYPNPTTGKMFLKNVPSDIKELIFYSVSGTEIKRIKKDELTSSYGIDCSLFAPAVYMLSAVSEGENIQLHKFVITE